LSLQPIGKKQNIDTFEEKILELLKEREGFIAVNSKSEAEEIMKVFGMSKKNFKRSVTALIAAKKIELFEQGIKAL
jgi:predicted RNA-binding protein (virulence factor B family)